MTLGQVPEGVTFLSRFGSNVDLILWFVRSRKELKTGIRKWAPRVGRGGMWILWPKKGSVLEADLKQEVVRETGWVLGWWTTRSPRWIRIGLG